MKIKLFALIICIVFLTGCWDRRELNDLGMVEAFGFDKSETTGEITMTCQIMRPGALKKDGGGGEKSPIEIISTSGKTVFEAIRNISMQFDRRAFFSHNNVIVINEQLAKDGVQNLIDVLVRNNEMRPLAWLIIAKDAKAQDILGVEHGIEEIQAAFLDGIIRKANVNSKVSVVNVQQFIKRISSTEINPIAGAMEITEQPVFPAEKKDKDTGVTHGVKLSGTAVFKKDKLMGYLDDIETRGLNWITGKVKSGIINVPSPTGKDKLISIVLDGEHADIKPKIKDGSISFIIEVKAEGDIWEQQNTTDVMDLKEFEKVESEFKSAIESEINGALEKVQKELCTDVFGFGSAFYKKYPKEWDKIKDNWQVLFPDVKYEIKVEARLKNTGLLLKPIKSGGE